MILGAFNLSGLIMVTLDFYSSGCSYWCVNLKVGISEGLLGLQQLTFLSIAVLLSLNNLLGATNKLGQIDYLSSYVRNLEYLVWHIWDKVAEKCW